MALDTIGPALTVAAFCDDAMLAQRAEGGAHDRAERLLSLIDATRRDAGWTWCQLELLAVTIGPGSFTAVRLGITAGRALALATSCQVLGVTSLEVLAEAAGPGEPVTALLDARRGAVFVQDFDAELVPTTAPRCIGNEALAAAVSARMRVAAAPSLLDAAAVERSGRVEVAPAAHYVARMARRRLASGGRSGPGTALAPLYLRDPDARPDAGRPLVAVAG